MSCGCSNNINYPCGCGSSSCTSCSSTSCEQIVYTGANLSCSGIDNNDNLCVALQKLDYAVCNPPGLTVTASNGLYKNLLLNDIRLGGSLTEVTTIGTSNTNTLSITGLATDASPLYVLVQTNLGVVRKSLVSTITASILAILTADNGLSYTSTNVQLGGSLIKPTTITAGSTNTLSIAGLVSNPSATYVVSVDNGTGLLTKTALSSIVPSTITANNGLTKTSSNIQLGGALITPTTVTTDTTNTLSIAGLVANTTPTYLLSQNGSDVTTKTLNSTFTNNILASVLADNGLNKVSNTIKLGGSLTATTFVELNQQTLNLRDTVYTSSTGLTIIPGNDPTTSDLNWALNTNTFAGKNIFSSFSYFANNVGIGTYPEPTTSATATSNVRLNVFRSTGYSNNPIAVTTVSTLDMTGNLGSGGTSIYAGSFGNLKWGPTSNQSVPTQGSISGNSSYLSLVSANDTTGGFLSASASQVYTAAASSIYITGVNSSGATITVPNTTNMTNIQVGYQVLIKSGVGNLGYINTYVETVNSGAFSFTIKRISGGSRGAWTYSSVTPSLALSSASILVAKAASGDDLGSIDIAIGSRILAPAPDAYSGSSVRIDSAVGLQIDDQLSNMPDYITPWVPASTLTSGYISESYGIKQKGVNDVNQLNGPLQLPSANTSIGTATLVGGTVTISTIAAKTGSRIFISRNTPGGTVGHLSAPAASITNGVSFVINSSSGTDTSTVNWWIIQS
ncbi:MAG: hypothetical protein EB127_03015 [Alphaproteobacteria bacterium]|nr:hypothetical protein [Alphaproteobacteria bacterium]